MIVKYWSKKDRIKICNSIVRVNKEYGLYKVFKEKFPSSKKLYDELTKSRVIETSLLDATWFIAFDNLLKKYTDDNKYTKDTCELLSSICVIDLAKLLVSFEGEKFKKLAMLVVDREFSFIFSDVLLGKGNKWKLLFSKEIVEKLTNHYIFFEDMIGTKYSKYFDQ